MRSTLATRETGISNDNIQDKTNDAASTTGEGAERHHRPEFRYITGILSRTTNKESATTTTTSTASLSQWFCPTHPLDPSIFHHLEEHPISNSHVSSPNNIKEKVKVEGEEGLEEEGEALAAEIEGNIWDTLVHESVMVMMVMDGSGSGKWGP